MNNTGDWGWLFNARKAHFFDCQGFSLCKRWALLGQPQGDGGNVRCRTCEKRFDAGAHEKVRARIASKALKEVFDE